MHLEFVEVQGEWFGARLNIILIALWDNLDDKSILNDALTHPNQRHSFLCSSISLTTDRAIMEILRLKHSRFPMEIHCPTFRR